MYRTRTFPPPITLRLAIAERLIAGEVGLTIVLLAASELLIRSLIYLEARASNGPLSSKRTSYAN